tara:strand:- start:519 stop:3803 length:3285 start_codon:yes stop_codon:yes gene_type:complete
MNSFNQLISQLNRFSKKYHAISTVRGLLVFSCYSIVLLVFVGLLEFVLNFSSTVRQVLFIGLVLILFTFFSSVVLIPFFRFLGLLKRIDHQSAAKLIGNEISEVGDKLLNTLQLAQKEKNYNSPQLLLLSASINQRAGELSSFSFSEALSFKKNKKFLFAFVFLLLGSSIGSFFSPNVVFSPLARVINYDQAFLPGIPFEFIVNNNENVKVLENDNLNIVIKTKGESVPKKVYIYSQDQRLLPVDNGDGSFSYSFKNVQKDFYFSVSDDDLCTKKIAVTVLPQARLSGLRTILSYPKYTKLSNDTVYEFNGFEVPFGTTMFFNFTTRNTSIFNVHFVDSVYSFNNSNENEFSFKYLPTTSQDFLITSQNSFSEFCDSNQGDILLIKDAFPEILVDEFYDSSFALQKYFNGKVKDDYGISLLTFNYELNQKIEKVKVPIKSNGINFFSFDFNFQKIAHESGESFSYYFEVWDNDALNGPKKTRSKKMVLKVPTSEEQSLADKKARENTVESFSNIEKEVESLKSELENIKTDLLSKKEMTWNDKNRLENFLKQQQQLQKNLENLQKDMAKKVQQSQKSKEILEKQQLLEKMMSELMTEEMNKLYEEMNKLMNEMNKDALLDKIDDVEMSQENLLKELDRSLEHFKRLEVENKAEKLAEKIQELSAKQRELGEKTKDKNESLFDLTKQQNKLQDDFFEIQNELSELEEMNNELESPKELNKEETEKNINDAMNKSENELENGKRKKSSESQQNAADKMDDLASSLNKMSSSSDQQEEDADALRQLLENLLTFSLEQEVLLKDLKNLSNQDPKYIGIGQNQRKLKDDVKIIEDSLDALGKRQIMISNKLNKEVQQIKRSLNYSIKNITERKQAVARSNQHSVMMHTNELALLLSEMLKQMQNNMPGTGKCNKPGGKGKNPGKSLSQNAEQLKKQIEQMKKMLSNQKGNQKGEGKPNYEQLGRLAAEQAIIKKQLMELAQELNKDGSGIGNGVQEMIKKIEKTEEEIIDNNFDLSSIVRQEEIKVKLLELEKALKEQDQKKEREAKEGIKKEEEIFNNKFEDYQRLKQREIDLLKTIPPNLKPYYKNKVNEYFNSIEN